MSWLSLLLLTALAIPSAAAVDQVASPSSQASGSPKVAAENEAVSSGTPKISLAEGEEVRLPANGATAAYPLDELYVEARLEDKWIKVRGKFAGHTELVIITNQNVRDLIVEVTPSAPVYPPGFIRQESGTLSPVVGSYEARYVSDQQQFQSMFDLTDQETNRTTQLHIFTTTLITAQPDESRFLVPSAFYKLKTPNWDLTLLDESVMNSPLTLDGSIVRGMHLKTGHWVFHAGYTSLATFNNFIFPLQMEEVVGASYTLPVTDHFRVTANLYDFFASNSALTTARPGPVASVVYDYQRGDRFEVLGEVAAGNGLGSAFQLRDSTATDDIIANFRRKPLTFHSLSFDNVPGSQGNLIWNRRFGTTVTNSVNLFEYQSLLPLGQQSNLTSSESLHTRIDTHWSVGTGATYASFTQTGGAGAYSLASLTLPQTIDFDQRHFGASFEFGYTRNSQGVASGRDFRPSIRFTAGAFSASAFVERQTEATTIDSILAEDPALQAELEALGISVSTPEQLQALLQNTAILQALGISPGANLRLVPTRDQVGGNLNWTSRRTGANQLNLGVVYTDDKSLLATSKNYDINASYVRELGHACNLSLSGSLIHVAIAGRVQTYPVAEIGIRRSFSGLPGFLSPRRQGNISGTIFQDDMGLGEFHKDMPSLPGVEVVLDGSRRMITDKNGTFLFSRVPDGAHFLEVNFHSTRPFWFTGPSKMSVRINQAANVGIRFASAELIGYLRNDADLGVEGAQVVVIGTTQHFRTQTDAQGRFSIVGLGSGNYQVSVDPNSLPPGYFLEELTPQNVTIEDGSPSIVSFRVRALRSISGRVTMFRASIGEYVPAPGVKVELQGLSTTTNSAGKFSFQDLPAGDYEIVLEWDDARVVQKVSLTTDPESARTDIRLPPAKTAVMNEDNR